MLLLISENCSHLSSSFNDRSSSLGGMKDYIDSSNFNTYGLSTKFLEGLGIQGPLHHKVFVANVSILCLESLFCFKYCHCILIIAEENCC